MKKILPMLLVLSAVQAEAVNLKCQVGSTEEVFYIAEDYPANGFATLQQENKEFVLTASHKESSGGCYVDVQKNYYSDLVSIVLHASYGRPRTRCAGSENGYSGTLTKAGEEPVQVSCQYDW